MADVQSSVIPTMLNVQGSTRHAPLIESPFMSNYSPSLTINASYHVVVPDSSLRHHFTLHEQHDTFHVSASTTPMVRLVLLGSLVMRLATSLG